MNNIADTSGSNNEKYYFLMLAIAILFIAKALYMSFFITPLWSIPDEIGHLAYTYDIAEGRGLPVVGEAKISSDIMSSYKGLDDAGPGSNWIAQHPPVYYYLAAIPLKVGMNFTDNQEILFKLPRIISAVSGGLLLIALFAGMRQAGLDGYRSLLISSAVGFIPMLSHLSSGVSHDSSIFLFSAVSAYFFTKYIMQKNIHDAYLMAFWITLAAGMKMTVWVVMPPLLAFVVLHLFLTSEKWPRHAFGVSLLALTVPVIWMSRNYYYFQDVFKTASGSYNLNVPLQHSFLDYLETQPVVEHFLLNFYGLLGWQSPGITGNSWFQVYDFPRYYFSIILVLTVVAMLVYSLNFIKRTTVSISKHEVSPAGFSLLDDYIMRRIVFHTGLVFVALMALSVGVISYITSYDTGDSGLLRSVAFSLFVTIAVISLFLIIWAIRNGDDFIFYLGVIVFSFFTCVLFYELYGVYLLDGRLRATHGRYFYPVMPFILLSVAVAIKKIRFPKFILALLVVGLAVAEMHSFVVQAIPFYWSFK